MKLSSIDYKVYQYVFEEDSEFISYLISKNGGGLIKSYCTSMTDAWKLLEKLSRKYEFNLTKNRRDNLYQCNISSEIKEGFAESVLPSMAICLAIIDFFDCKDKYIIESESIIRETYEIIESNKEKLKAIGIDIDLMKSD